MTPTIFVSCDVGVHHITDLPELVLQVLPGGLKAQIGDEAALPTHHTRQCQYESQEMQEVLADRNGCTEFCRRKLPAEQGTLAASEQSEKYN
jgi:hypothetical protein